MDTLKKAERTTLIRYISKIFKIRNTNLQFQGLGYGLQKNKQKKDTRNW